MRFGPVKLSTVRLGVLLLPDRLAVAAATGERLETFSIATENPAAVLREELTNRQLTPRTVALALPRTSVFVRPMELPTVGGDTREMVRLNLEGHLPFVGDDTAFDFLPLPTEGEGTQRDGALRRVLLVAAEPRIVDAALRIAEEARLRPASLTVAAHDLLALARPEAGQRVVWLHQTGGSADILCLLGPSLVLSRAAPVPDEASVVEEVRRSMAAVRWRECDAVWISGDLPLDAMETTTFPAPVREPAYIPRVRERLASLSGEDRGVQELATAVAMGRRARTLDLLPLRLRPRRLSRAQGVTLGIAAITALLLLAALLVPGVRERNELARINDEIARLEPQVRGVERVVRDLERKRKLLGTITGIEASALRPLPVMRELTDLLPADTWLTTMSLDGKGVELTGQAAAASALIPLLENSARLERVEFSSPVTRGRDKEQFRIRAAWEAGAAQAMLAPPAASPPATVVPPPAVVQPPPGVVQPPPGAVQPAPGTVQAPPGGAQSPGVAQPPPGVVQPAPGVVQPPSPQRGPQTPRVPGARQ
jgi:Tfp pilus assembly protein PilN